MKKIYLILIVLIGLAGCEKNDPEPEVIRAYCYFYNFLMSDPVMWEVNGVELPETEYGNRFLGAVLLNSEREEIYFAVKNADWGTVYGSQMVQLEKNRYYVMVICGTDDDPELLIREEVRSDPGGGMIRFQFLQAASDLDSLDVYMGGTDPTDKVLPAIDYTEFSDYFLVEDYKARASTFVTKAGDAFEQDSLLIDYQYNDPLQTEFNYMVVVAHENDLFTSDITLFLYSHSVY